MKHIITMLLALVMAVSFCACASAPVEELPAEENQEQQEILTEADPQKALDEIYAQLWTRSNTGLMNATYEDVRDVMGFDLDTIEEFYIRYLETDYGASDVYIIKPKAGKENEVRQAMKNWQESRVRSFIGYDIYNSTEISENAVIFQRGDYLVMLMLEDNDAARSILEQYIPEELHLID